MSIIFSYAFDTTAKNQLDNSNTRIPDDVRTTDVKRSLDNTTVAGRGWEIRSEAAHPSGTGLGVRHYRGSGNNGQGAGHNDNSGGIILVMPSAQTELWVRCYMRFQSGFSWNGGTPEYTKDHYWGGGAEPIFLFGHQGGAWGVNYAGTTNYPGTKTWADVMGGATGDGLWHCYEYHFRFSGATGLLEFWIDNVAAGSYSNIDMGSSGISSFKLGENQATVVGSGTADYYTDYDEVVISDSARVGPLSGGGSTSTLRPQSVM